MTANASVTARGGQFDASGQLDAAAMRGHVRVDARLPGARLTADGGIDGDAIRGQAMLDATDLAAAARRLRLDDHTPPAAIAGSGRRQRRGHRHPWRAVAARDGALSLAARR